MDLRHSPEHEAFRADVRAFLREAWPPEGEEAALPVERQHALFRERAVARGYLFREIPRRYGGSEQPSDAIRDAILLEEFAASGVPGSLPSVGPAMLAPRSSSGAATTRRSASSRRRSATRSAGARATASPARAATSPRSRAARSSRAASG